MFVGDIFIFIALLASGIDFQYYHFLMLVQLTLNILHQLSWFLVTAMRLIGISGVFDCNRQTTANECFLGITFLFGSPPIKKWT